MENVKKAEIYDFVVRCEIDGELKDFLFDYVEDTTTNLSSSITTFPLVNGDTISDHMYIEPTSLSVAGTFSLLGNKKYEFGKLDRLANIQDVFERIMKDGIMCTLVKKSLDGNESRFKVRKNMVLTNISWVEHQTSIDFNFSFHEALTSIVTEEDYKVDVIDTSLPIITDPNSLDVTDELLDKNAIMEYTISILEEAGLIDDGFLEHIINEVKDRSVGGAVGGLLGGSIAGAAGITVLSIIFGGLAAIPGPGWIALGVLVAVGAVAGLVYGIIKGFNQHKFKIKAFKRYKKDNDQLKEDKRFVEFIGEIYKQFEDLEQHMQLLSFGKDVSQQCFVTIDNNQYIFTFSKSTEESNYSLKIKDVNDKDIPGTEDISQKAITTLNECSVAGDLFTTDSGCQVYLVNRKVFAKRQSNASNEEIERLNKDLTNYAILSSTIDLTKFKEIMEKIIKSAIYK